MTTRSPSMLLAGPAVAGWLVLGAVLACVTPAHAVNENPESPAERQADASGLPEGCTASDNYLSQTTFEAGPGERSAWGASQHSSKRSFELSVQDGTLTIEQTAREPWVIFRQRVDGAPLAGRSMQFSAETWGNVLTEPKLHGFEHKAGLLYRVQTRSRERLSSSAEQLPNTGEWDWQRVSVRFDVPADARWVEVGFMHQAGGTFKARLPELVSIECD